MKPASRAPKQSPVERRGPARPAPAIAALLGLVAVGCAASSKPGAPAQEAAPSSAGDASPLAAPSAPEQPALSAGSADGAGSGSVSAAQAELDRAERDLEALLSGAAQRSTPLATDECSTACRALGSMQRSLLKLCEIGDAAEASRCESARSRVARAEARVRERCPACSAPR